MRPVLAENIFRTGNSVVSSMSVDNSPVDFTPALKQEFVIVQACIFFGHSSKL